MDYYLESQEDIDNFSSEISTITGELVIGFANFSSELSNITDLSPLMNLEKVEGDLTIENNPDLSSLQGLNNLSEVGGLMTIKNLENLGNIQGLNGLTLSNGIEIIECPEIENFIGLENLNNINGKLRINTNESLTSLQGLDNIHTITGDLVFWQCLALKNLAGLENLTNVGGGLGLESKFHTLNGLNNLTIVGGRLHILSTDIYDIGALSNLESVGGELRFSSCYSLSNLNGLDNLSNVGDLIHISNSSILNNIEALSKINTLNGSLQLSNNDNLTSLEGLHNVTYINGIISLRSNDRLENLDGLRNLNRVEKTISISDNSILANIDGLLKIDTMDGGLYLHNNPSLEHLNGLSNLEFIDSKFTISKNPSLENLDPLSKLKHLDYALVIEENENLSNLDGLRNLEYLGSFMVINNNSKITNLDAFINLDSIHSLLEIVDNDKLEDVNGLQNVVYVGMDLKIAGNNQLSDCCGIRQLIENANAVVGNVIINGNIADCVNEQAIEVASCADDYFRIFGNVFYDSNQNKIKDQDEFGIQGVKIYTLEDPGVALTNSNGNFSLKITKNLTSTLGIEYHEDIEITTDSSIYSILYDSTSNEDYDFGVYSSSIEPSLLISMTSEDARCNSEVDFYIKILNDGFVPSNCELKINIDALTEFVSSSPMLIEENDYLSLPFQNLLPFQSLDIELKIDMPSEMFTGEDLSFSGAVYYWNALEELEILDESEYQTTVLCSYDPNDKQVNPIGVKDENYTLLSDELNYTIRFQNTGNAPAIDVTILDTLDESLDIESFRVLNSSHAVRTNVDGRAVEFYFKDIFLVDSLSNEPESHGFIQYSIRPGIEIDELTEIENTAHIIFDFNPPIITNTTKNTMVDMICLDVFTSLSMTICEGEDFMGFTESGDYNLKIPIGITCDSIVSLELIVLPESDPACIVSTDDKNNFELEIYPNPVENIIFIKGEITGLTHQLMDIQGKILIMSEENEIDIYDILPGVYFLKSYKAELTSVTKLVKL